MREAEARRVAQKAGAVTEPLYPDREAPPEEQRRGYLGLWRAFGPGGGMELVVSADAIAADAARWLLANAGFTRDSDRKRAEAFLVEFERRRDRW